MGEVEFIDLPTQYELRVSLKMNQHVTIEILSGRVLSFGWILPLNQILRFDDEPFALLCLENAKIKIIGSKFPYYMCNGEVPEKAVVQTKKQVVIITGIPGCGKTSLCKWICNLRLIDDYETYYVNADVSQAHIGPYGTVGVIRVSKPIDNEGFAFTEPLLFYFGATEIKDSRLLLYKGQLMEAGQAALKRIQHAEKGCMVIDFPHVTDNIMLDVLIDIASSFGATDIVCMGDELLKKAIHRANPALPVDCIPALPGAIRLEPTALREYKQRQTKRYFYGTRSRPLTPVRLTVPRPEFRLHSLGTLTYISSLMLPSDAEKPNPLHLNPVGLSSMVVRKIVAAVGLNGVPKEDEDWKSEVWKRNAIGFFAILGMGDGTVEVLAPSLQETPPHVKVAGNVDFNPDA